MTKPTLLVLAAGIGSRYGGLKQIDPIGPGGETIIDYSVYDALRAGFGKLVFVIRRDIEATFREVIGSRFEKRIAVDYVFQELTGLAAGFFRAARPNEALGHRSRGAHGRLRRPGAVCADQRGRFLRARFLSNALEISCNLGARITRWWVLSCATPFPNSAASRAGSASSTPDEYLESVVELTKIEKDGAGAKHTDSAGKVHPLTGDEIVSLNMWGFRPSLFTHLQREFAVFLQQEGANPKAEFFIPTVVNTLINTGETRLKVLPTSSSWFGVTYREDRPRVVASIRELIQRGDYPEKLWS